MPSIFKFNTQGCATAYRIAPTDPPPSAKDAAKGAFRKIINDGFEPKMLCACGLCILLGFLATFVWAVVILSGVTNSVGEALHVVDVSFVSNLANHTLNIMTNVDASTSEAEHMLKSVRSVGDVATPAMLRGVPTLEGIVEKTVDMVSNVQAMVAHPVLKLSVET